MFFLSLLWGGFSKFIGAAFTFLTTKPGVYLLLIGMAAGTIWYAHHSGYNEATADAAHAQQLAVAQAEANREGMLIQRNLDANIANAAEAAGFARGKAQAQTVTITKEIPKYVTVEVDRSFPMPCGLVRLHDAAASGVDPQAISIPSGLADDVACPIKASDLASVVVANYGLYHEAEAQIAGLQNLAKTLKATIEGSP